MKIYQVKQRTDRWFNLRRGKWTASQLKRIVTPAHLSASKSWDAYIDEIVAEIVLGKPLGKDKGQTASMARGAYAEPRARASFEVETGMPVEHVGGIETDDEWGWCSPDGLLDDGAMGYEGKVPDPDTHVGFRRRPGSLTTYCKLQVQGSLWICKPEIEVWYVHSWNPEFDDVIEMVEPDEKVQAALDEHIPAFIEELKAACDAEMGEGWRDNPFL